CSRSAGPAGTAGRFGQQREFARLAVQLTGPPASDGTRGVACRGGVRRRTTPDPFFFIVPESKAPRLLQGAGVLGAYQKSSGVPELRTGTDRFVFQVAVAFVVPFAVGERFDKALQVVAASGVLQ